MAISNSNPNNTTTDSFNLNNNNTNTINDPLHIASSDHPGMALTNTPFNGGNFLGWSRNVKMALGAKLKLGFIDGSCPKPAITDENVQRWVRCDYMVTCWILNSMESHKHLLPVFSLNKLAFSNVVNNEVPLAPSIPIPTPMPNIQNMEPPIHDSPELSIPHTEPPNEPQPSYVAPINPPMPSRKSTRTSTKPAWLRDFVTPKSTTSTTNFCSTKPQYPLFGKTDFKDVPPPFIAFLANCTSFVSVTIATMFSYASSLMFR
ncbi:hypothetical protein CTI12_AA612890 [Artemisia annua]|uniref:Retrotransposon Copia-like N-terminal domain-containing protein n=1 Tax=Artemisia annua TaxID=35608 RepID=A0A2U1KE68_ARTAN|nr:hypothetical protein CTI12_AA612890 [Artemisia annua]